MSEIGNSKFYWSLSAFKLLLLFLLLVVIVFLKIIQL